MADHNLQGFLRKTVPLSGDQGPICPNTIFLDQNKTTTFGRTASSETNVRLLSSKTPLMISRKHASISCNNGIWSILDHNSMNGVFINGQQIPSSKPHEIRPGDRICFGIANNVHEFDFTFDVASGSRKRKTDICEKTNEKMRKVLQESIENQEGTSGINSSSENICKDKMISLKIKQSEKKIETLRLLLDEKEQAYQSEMKDKERYLAEQLLQQKESLEKEKKEQEEHLLSLLEDRLQEKERELGDQLEQQKTILLAEKKMIENNLRLELDRKLEEKDKELTTQLENQRDRLQDIVNMKMFEQQKLQDELNKNKIEREKLLGLEEKEKKMSRSLEMLRAELEEKQSLLTKQQDVTRQAEEMAKKAVVEQMEDEFTCIICQELFIQATTLTCSHSFCDYCLKSWLRKQNSCPICRANVDRTFVRSIVLDNAIEKIVRSMDDEMRERRVKIIEDRKKLNKDVITIIQDGHQTTRGNQGNPIIVSPTMSRDNDVQIVERPPTQVRHPQIVISTSSVNHHQAQRVQGNQAAQVQTRLHAQRTQRPGPTIQVQSAIRTGHVQPAITQQHVTQATRTTAVASTERQRRTHSNGSRNNNQHCYVCGMRGHWARTCPFR